MNLKTHKFQITGITSLLQNSSNTFSDTSSEIKGNKKFTKEQEAESKVWRDADGFFHPTQAFRSAMLTAAGGKKIGKRTARTALQMSVFCSEEKLRLLNPDDGTPVKNYIIDSRPFSTKMGSMLMTHRPKFEKWSGILKLEIDIEMLTQPLVVEDVLNEAGLFPGVGSYRIAKGGPFGRFTAKMI